ncbi:helix-turn-helix domain-containing protein [Enterobacter hormaechei]|uniref:helix-turn-helix domain-containing protein n=1 Tax=Enterobacter hormaechei TaxID=158836 RepID=UPI001C24D4B4|nr:helix-turn-helix domain-containing protein [Enterobacter hormaechei]QXC22982.1 helix-turn-helix domain-containing protein [Enterobacter hormaechei]
MLKTVIPEQYNERDLNIIHLASLLNSEVERGVAFEQAQELVDVYADRGESSYANALVTLFNAAMKPPKEIEFKISSPYLHDKNLSPSERLVLMHLESLPSLTNVKQESIAIVLGISVATVSSAIRKLRRNGYLTTTLIKPGRGKGCDITLTTK